MNIYQLVRRITRNIDLPQFHHTNSQKFIGIWYLLELLNLSQYICL